MSRRSNSIALVVANRLLVGEATKALVAAPGAANVLRVFKITASVLTPAAQTVEVGVDGGTVSQQLMVLPASYAGQMTFESENGFLLPANTALSAKPAAAGPAIQFVVEYVIEPVIA